ncbi:hypothetical protein B0H19DRAFT_1259451 [Mycena capillaripes]|nr:hypothetical protein B0H19DRAFT_1259451 [Mycena capillaripes]
MLPSESESSASTESENESENDSVSPHLDPPFELEGHHEDPIHLGFPTREQSDDSSDSAAASTSYDMIIDSDSESSECPEYFNSLNPEEDENLELDGWGGFDEILDADEPILREQIIAQLDKMLGPDQELWSMRNDILTEQDRDNIRAFWLMLLSNMLREEFEQM